VNTGALGTYVLEYLKVDSAGNSVSELRTVNVVDTTLPGVSLMGGSPISLLIGGTYTESGATWIDLHDGSGSLLLPTSGSVDTNNTGTYILTYDYVDISGNTGSTTRTVHVLSTPDVTPPVVTLSGSASITSGIGMTFIDDGASWTDNVDGSGLIGGYNSGTVNTGALGTYTISYVYIDSSGNTGSVDRTVQITDMTPPIVTLSGPNPATIIVGNSYTDPGASWTDNVDGSGTIATFNNGTLDTNNTGSYTISYAYTDAAGNTGSTNRSVNVVDTPDTTPPVITLSGTSVVSVEFGSSFVDQ
jgi:Domain of unknown function (DUF5011)